MKIVSLNTFPTFCVRLLSLLRGHSVFSSPPQRSMTSDFEGFLYQILSIIFLSLFLRKSQYFPFQCWVLNEETTGTIFITSLVWRGPWLGIVCCCWFVLTFVSSLVVQYTTWWRFSRLILPPTLPQGVQTWQQVPINSSPGWIMCSKCWVNIRTILDLTWVVIEYKLLCNGFRDELSRESLASFINIFGTSFIQGYVYIKITTNVRFIYHMF